MKRLISLLSLVLAVTASNSPVHVRSRFGSRIVGGIETTIDKHPYQLALRRRNQPYCGAAIIGPTWVITAAHCLDDNPPVGEVFFRAGSTDHAEGGQIVPAAGYKLHPNYNSSVFSWDAALVRVKTAFEYNENVQPIRLPDNGWEPRVGELATVSGWGRWGETSSVRLLRSVEIPIISNEQCDAAWPGIRDETVLCAGSPGKSACNGDSGGPLAQVEGDLLIGVVSWGSSVCEDAQPGAYTKLAYPPIRDWIREYTGGI